MMCRNCIYLKQETYKGPPIRGKVIFEKATCLKGRWVHQPSGAAQWYSMQTVLRNRPPVRQLGDWCPKFRMPLLGLWQGFCEWLATQPFEAAKHPPKESGWGVLVAEHTEAVQERIHVRLVFWNHTDGWRLERGWRERLDELLRRRVLEARR